MDGCVTGFNENLSMELMKFTLGIFNAKARDKEYTWRNLGAVTQFQKVKPKQLKTWKNWDILMPMVISV
jgi:hypothetical protein